MAGHDACLARAAIGVFNRSHYEDVLVVRVKGFAPKPVWSKRFRHINEFERMLSDEGTTIIKCFLNVSKDGAGATLSSSPRRPVEELEVQGGRPRRPQAVAEMPAGLRRRDLSDVDLVRPLVCRARRPQLGPQPRCCQDPAEHVATARPEVSPARTSCKEHQDRVDRLVLCLDEM